MQSPDTRPPESERGPGYETRDVDPKIVVWLVVSIALVVAGSMVGLHLLLDSHSASATRTHLPRKSAVDQTPPEPRLQSTPIRDYEAFVAEQEQQLHSYGWVDRQKGIVRLPIDRVMDLAIEKGLRFPAAIEQSPSSPAQPPETKE